MQTIVIKKPYPKQMNLKITVYKMNLVMIILLNANPVMK